MAQYHVTPVNDADPASHSAWVVQKSSRKTPLSDHRKKSAAIRRAKREANKGDKIRIAKRNGQTQRWMTK